MVSRMMNYIPNIEEALRHNLEWYRNSGVMMPPDGSWGVGERVAIFNGNTASERIRSQFRAITLRGTYGILEHRRPDCNFELAALFFFIGDYFGDETYRQIGENILAYLFEKSALCGVDKDSDVWNWHNALNGKEFWFDDNGWCATAEILLGRLYPDLERRFGMCASGLRLVKKLKEGLERSIVSTQPISHGHWPDPAGYWFGEIRQPHWGTPVCIALLLAGEVESVVHYYQTVEPLLKKQSVSECCYALLGAAVGLFCTGDEFFRGFMERLLERLIPRADSATGSLPSEHCEAPIGTAVADLIYTDNWFFAALPWVVETTGNFRAKELLEQLLKFLLKIQDNSSDQVFRGCWRGMFDRTAGCWGGGNCHEGGADSIYTGWTNAVIALTLLKLLHVQEVHR